MKRRSARIDRKALLRWAIAFVTENTNVLADCHRNPITKRIEPASVREEVQAARRWLRKAKEATK